MLYEARYCITRVQLELASWRDITAPKKKQNKKTPKVQTFFSFIIPLTLASIDIWLKMEAKTYDPETAP